jgi:succinyl-diaminopimelate desuccinylase
MIDNNMINSLKALLSIDSVEGERTDAFPFGEGVSKALHYMLDLGHALGFKTKNCDEYAGYIEFGDGDEMVGILCHLDVVPAGSGWTKPPFEGILENDRLYGRGALDDKGPAIASLFAMYKLKESGYTPKKRIRLILGTNEESGSKCMAYYCDHEELPTVAFSPDADFPVIHGEMGIISASLKKEFNDLLEDGGIKVLSLHGGSAVNMVPDQARAVLIENKPVKSIVDAFNETHGDVLSYQMLNDETKEVEITAKGISAHASTPEKGTNAIVILLDFLSLIDLEIGDLSNFIRSLRHLIGYETDGNALNIALKDAYNALVLNLGVIHLDEQRGEAAINIRYPITSKGDFIKELLEKTLAPFEVNLSNWHDVDPLFYPPSHPLVTTLMDVYQTVTGDINAKPITIGGGTYARSMPNAIAFGAMFPDSEDCMHQKDEYITLNDLDRMSRIFLEAIKALSSQAKGFAPTSSHNKSV